jgi:hypothetical protein
MVGCDSFFLNRSSCILCHTYWHLWKKNLSDVFRPRNPITDSLFSISLIPIEGFSFNIYETTSLLASVNPGAFFMYSFSLDSLNSLSHFIIYGANSINFLINSSRNLSSVNYGYLIFCFLYASSKTVKCYTNPTPAAS